MPPAGGHACVSDHCLTVRRRVLGEDVDADNIIATRTGCPPRVLGRCIVQSSYQRPFISLQILRWCRPKEIQLWWLALCR